MADVNIERPISKTSAEQIRIAVKMAETDYPGHKLVGVEVREKKGVPHIALLLDKR